jgi:hypothetical protein
VTLPASHRIPPATQRALAEQTTTELMREIHRYARSRARRVHRAGVPVSPVRELVHDAHADTCVGVLRWDPCRCSLAAHLGRAIKRRTCREIQRARGYVFVSLDHAAQVPSPPLEDVLVRAQLAMMLAEVCRQLRRLVRAEPEVSKLTRCWEEGLVDEDEIRERTGFSRSDYARARKRAVYAIPQLPAALCEATRDLLR